MANSHPDLSLQRSKSAWEKADEAKRRFSLKTYKEYVTLVKNLPTRISNNGLGQTLAFLKSKGKGNDRNPEHWLYQYLSSWLMVERGVYKTNEANRGHDLMQRVQNGDGDVYRRAMSETMEFVTWLKLHSDSLLEDDDNKRFDNEDKTDLPEGKKTAE